MNALSAFAERDVDKPRPVRVKVTSDTFETLQPQFTIKASAAVPACEAPLYYLGVRVEIDDDIEDQAQVFDQYGHMQKINVL